MKTGAMLAAATVAMLTFSVAAQTQQQSDQAAQPMQDQPVYGYGAPNATVSTPAEPPDQQQAQIPDEKQLAYPTDKREPSLARELTDMVQQRKQQK